jgi:hypothetical protein
LDGGFSKKREIPFLLFAGLLVNYSNFACEFAALFLDRINKHYKIKIVHQVESDDMLNWSWWLLILYS